MADGTSPQEAQEILRIAHDYFLQESGSEEGAQDLMRRLAGAVKEPGTKLIHLGNVLFLVLVRGQGVLEFHTIGSEASAQAYAQDLVDLAKYVRNIGAKMAYTYTESRAFDRVARLTGLPITKTLSNIDGKQVYVYAMEF
jgi:hypothetical protein